MPTTTQHGYLYLITQNHFDKMIARAAELANEEFTKSRGG
jgi:hypothetical protein